MLLCFIVLVRNDENKDDQSIIMMFLNVDKLWSIQLIQFGLLYFPLRTVGSISSQHSDAEEATPEGSGKGMQRDADSTPVVRENDSGSCRYSMVTDPSTGEPCPICSGRCSGACLRNLPRNSMDASYGQDTKRTSTDFYPYQDPEEATPERSDKEMQRDAADSTPVVRESVSGSCRYSMVTDPSTGEPCPICSGRCSGACLRSLPRNSMDASYGQDTKGTSTDFYGNGSDAVSNQYPKEHTPPPFEEANGVRCRNFRMPAAGCSCDCNEKGTSRSSSKGVGKEEINNR